jgi:hypothetical protein
MSAFPTKNLIFLKDSKNNFNFLVDSGASISILPHSSSAPPTGPHIVGANGDIVPVWGRRRRQIVTFAGQDFEFDFFLAAVATPIIGMDFLTAVITSDRGAQFTSSLWAALCGLLNIQHNQTTAYHLQSNGMVERFHRRLKDALRARCAAANLVDHLPWVLLGLRAAPREDDGSTPTQEVFGTPLIFRFTRNTSQNFS